MDGGGSPHQQRRSAALIRPHRGRCVTPAILSPPPRKWGDGRDAERTLAGDASDKSSAALNVTPNAAAVAREVGGVSGVGVWRIAQVEGIELTHSYRPSAAAARPAWCSSRPRCWLLRVSVQAERRGGWSPHAIVAIRTTPHAAGTVLGLQCEDDLGIGRKHYTRPNSYQGECHSCGCEICAHGQ